MSTVLIVTNESEAQRMIPWGKLLARCESDSLVVVIAQEKPGDREWEEVELKERSDDDDSVPDLAQSVRRLAGLESPDPDAADGEAITLTTFRLRDGSPDKALLELLPKLGCKQLILPLDEITRESEQRWMGKLYRTSPSETLYLRSQPDRVAAKKILVLVSECENSYAALRRAVSIAGEFEGEVTAAYIQADTGELSREVGQRVLERNVQRSVGRRRADDIRKMVIVGNDLVDGIRETMNRAPHLFDLVLVGANRHRTIRKIFFGKLSTECFSGENSHGYATVRAGFPFSTRFQQFWERQVQAFVPQLDRDSRVALVERVQTSSNWDFDFMALICLSTCIAALGLVRNQAAVVIGAMLVAPLMTPLAGAGLALVQGNGALIKSALKSVLFGFLLALIIGVLVGLFVPMDGDGIPAELIGRTSPALPDLLVALVGGIAAAYAMSRPHLSSALPGVAIAAALVPPIATAGIMLALGEWSFSRGAVLLFVTNIVAIILGTAISLRLVGIRDAHTHGSKSMWTRRFTAALLALIIGVGFIISHQAPKTGHATLDDVTEKIATASREIGAKLVSAQRTGESELTVVVESPDDDLGELPNEIHALATDGLEDPDMIVKLEVRHVVKVPAEPEIVTEPTEDTKPTEPAESSVAPSA